MLRGKPVSIACDRWTRVEDNIHSLELTVNALRGIERWGSSEMLERAYQGFAALPEKAGDTDGDQAWWIVLGVDPEWPLKQMESVYKQASLIHHPDRGGTHEKQAQLNEAIAQARAEKGR
jgi:hypothetical protein